MSVSYLMYGYVSATGYASANQNLISRNLGMFTSFQGNVKR